MSSPKTDQLALLASVAKDRKNDAMEESNGMQKRVAEDSEEKKHRKRLSIDTRLLDKLEADPVIMEQMKSSFKVKQQQQAIIEQRNKSARLDRQPHSARPASNSTPSANGKSSKLLPREWPGSQSAIDLASPRGEFPNRELPLPRGYEPKPSSPHIQTSLPSAIVPPMISRTAFLSVFESMYDQHDSAMRLQGQLKDLLRKTSTLLQTLQSSGQMIEGLVRGHFREMQSQYGERFGAALTDVNRRLINLEQKMGLSPVEGDMFTNTGALKSAAPKTANTEGAFTFKDQSPKILEAILSRLDALEKQSSKEL